ncbi:MAG: hypothetical protein Q7U98_18905 [Methylicorpusculum sp.]|uniref:hypothetical protein n=1 Tax=Methylicorpusculum sp. TaxID=2713644 RepID=UPI00271D0C76|nr:hypothetical protein [Methylicorpusculum sp.]MDO8846310.1 hypothetical protein [Methylicorpusculum sp.]MDO8941229.1 hypothetical protein [Methylicorpusculum sp.]MDO9240714.1 hypothetical protein [Methylicorpusculum sp.]MDP2178875.1 hypothetical protein [Methylicorpusculum sp.]MDP2203713.1 hypothetical protein [Methylicorpusculum sp.]
MVGQSGIEIAKPVSEVYDFVVERFFENYTRWALEVVEFKPINDNKMDVGALARQTRIDQGQKIESTFEVVTMEKDKLLVLNGLSSPFRNSYIFDSIESDTPQTRLTFSFELLEIELFMRPFEKLIRIAIEEGAQHTVNNIKNLLAPDAESETNLG